LVGKIPLYKRGIFFNHNDKSWSITENGQLTTAKTTLKPLKYPKEYLFVADKAIKNKNGGSYEY